MQQQRYYAVLPRFRQPNDGGGAGLAAVYDEESDGVAVYLTPSITEAKQHARNLNADNED